MSTLRFAPLLVVLLAGCREVPSEQLRAPRPDAASSALSAEEFPELERGAICGLGVGCCARSSVTLDPDACKLAFPEGFQGELRGITPELLAGGNVAFDGVEAARCLSAIGALGCGALGGPAYSAAVASCAGVFAGLLALGEACTASPECRAGSFCDAGVCAPLRASGDACASSDECGARGSADFCDPDSLSCAPRRAEGAACAWSAECASGLCEAGACVAQIEGYFSFDRCQVPLGGAPYPCGVAVGPLCEDGERCASGADCLSGACSALRGRCVSGRSCALAAGDSPAGVETCGAGETTGANAHESCCKSLPLPVTPWRRLDKYEVTAGRIRRFVAGVTAQYGVTNIRRWAYEYAAEHPDSQLGYMAIHYPTVLDVLPDSAQSNAKPPLAVHLGAFPLDPINALDGCYVGAGGYGHATYHQDAATLANYGLPPRRFTQEQLDEKPMNCVMPLFAMAFCAWDGGELAAATDFQEVWGTHAERVNTTTVYIPWDTLLGPGDINWRNGQNSTFDCISGWPGCFPYSVNPADPVQPIFYRYPTRYSNNAPIDLADDQSPLMSAPGRFPLDATTITSIGGEPWMDIGGLSLEIGWVPDPPTSVGSGTVQDICDVSSWPQPGEVGCVRRGQQGTLRHAGPLPHVPYFGYSWEGHARVNEAWLAGTSPNPASYRVITFQYGKVGARCSRVY